ALSDAQERASDQQLLGRDLPQRGDDLRDFSHPPVHALHPRRSSRRGAHRRRRRVPHLLEDRFAAGAAGPGHAGHFHLHVELERFHVAADRADRQQQVHPSRGRGQSRGRARAGHRVDDGQLRADRSSGADPLPGPAAPLHRRDHGGKREGMRAESRKQKAEMAVIISAFCFLLSALSAVARVIDDFKALDWSPRPSDGVSLSIVSDTAGHAGAAMRLDFDFHGHGGYAIAHKNVSIDLPSDYQFSFWIRGNARPNNLEFKLIDATGDNVWWINQRNFEFPRDWTRLVLKKRHFQFAWGPLGGGEPRHIAAIEIVVTAGSGGRGSVWIDDLDLQEHHVTAVEQA